MNAQEIETICKERLGRWTQKLVQEHATPVILIAVGHDHRKGQLVLLTTEERSDRDIEEFLAGALMKLWGYHR